ncbi:hypothetical protein DITRI_Ditri05aG0081600 [Diplodiscus trichospermus]
MAQIQKDMDKLEAKLESTTVEMRNGLETMGIDVRKMFELMMLKLETSFNTSSLEETTSSKTTNSRLKGVLAEGNENRAIVGFQKEQGNLTEPSRLLTKSSKIECPRFEGVDFRGWLLKI